MTATSLISNYFAGEILLNYLTNHDTYLGMHEADPTDLGLLDTEVAGQDYARQLLKHGNPSTKTVVSTNAQKFTALPACEVTWLAVWDSPTTGHLLYRIPLVTPILVLINGQFLAAPGDVALTL